MRANIGYILNISVKRVICLRCIAAQCTSYTSISGTHWTGLLTYSNVCVATLEAFYRVSDSWAPSKPGTLRMATFKCCQKKGVNLFLHGMVWKVSYGNHSNVSMQKKVYTFFWQHLNVGRRWIPGLLGAQLSLTLKGTFSYNILSKFHIYCR